MLGLQDAQEAIPKGTLLAIVATTIIYLGAVWLTGSTCVRDAPGLLLNLPVNRTEFWTQPGLACATNHTCPYGLLNYFQVASCWIDRIRFQISGLHHMQ